VTKGLAVAALAMNCLAAHAAGIQTEHVVTYVEDGHERAEFGRWIRDASGRTRLDMDDWTQIVDPVPTWAAAMAPMPCSVAGRIGIDPAVRRRIAQSG